MPEHIPTNYGTNNEEAFTDTCPVRSKEKGCLDWHKWEYQRELGRCYTEHKCKYCHAVHRIDSTD